MPLRLLYMYMYVVSGYFSFHSTCTCICWKLLGNGMYISTHAYCILQAINCVQGISKFGAKWHGTFEATALVW